MKFTWRYPVFLICLTCLISACQRKTDHAESTRFFYFDSLKLGGAGQVYIYESVNNPVNPDEIWHKRFSGDYHDSHIYSAMLNPDGEILQKTTESVVQTGSTLIKMELFYHEPDSLNGSNEDTAQSLRATIVHPTTFLFGVPDSTVAAKYQIEYVEPGPDSIRVILSRMRRYAGDTTWVFEGKTYPAMQFIVDETLETETEGFTTSEWETAEIYAKGIGLVYYKKAVSPEFVLEYQLREIVPYETYSATR